MNERSLRVYNERKAIAENEDNNILIATLAAMKSLQKESILMRILYKSCRVSIVEMAIRDVLKERLVYKTDYANKTPKDEYLERKIDEVIARYQRR